MGLSVACFRKIITSLELVITHSLVTMADTSKAEDKKKTVDLGLLEEDDEFEEFPAEEWDKKDEDATDVNVWEDNWDDDTIEDDFAVQLRSELQSQGVKMET